MLPDCGDKQILVAEDNPVNRKLVSAMLAKLQMKADFAENGQVALELLVVQAYRLVLMDCQMPVIDGYEATRIHRSRETHQPNIRRTAIVALTADDASDKLDACLEAGMDDFLSKPIDFDALTAILKKWLTDDRQTGIISSTQAETAACESPGENGCWNESAVLKSLEGDEQLLNELIGLFIENMPEHLGKLNQALLKNQLTLVADEAHAIKSMVSNFHAESTKSLAARLERSARHGEPSDLTTMTSNLIAAIEQLISILQQRKGANS